MAEGESMAIFKRAEATAKGINLVAHALHSGGGNDAATLRVAEQYIDVRPGCLLGSLADGWWLGAADVIMLCSLLAGPMRCGARCAACVHVLCCMFQALRACLLPVLADRKGSCKLLIP